MLIDSDLGDTQSCQPCMGFATWFPPLSGKLPICNQWTGLVDWTGGLTLKTLNNWRVEAQKDILYCVALKNL